MVRHCDEHDDAAVGGAETLTVVFTNWQSTTVTFEYNQDVPGIESVVDQMRAIRSSLVPLLAVTSAGGGELPSGPANRCLQAV